MGKRVERFFEFYIDKAENYSLIAANLQIIQYKKTFGELDFLIQHSKTFKKIHVELVYKFYVYDPKITGTYEQWIGPNRNDSLVRKIRKLIHKQLPLLQEKVTQEKLAELHCKSTDFQQKVCFKANLFLPKNSSKTSIQLSGINPDCVVGFWIYFKEFTSSNYGQAHFFSPTKQNWPVSPSKNRQWYTYEDILPKIKAFIAENRSPLVWMKTQNTFQRFFIVWW